jgi:hypothetical protein
MNDAWVWWLFAIGLAVGAATVWFVRGTIAREEDDLAADERSLEAGWVADTIERAGGVAPVPLVEQVLELHHDYLHRSPPYLAGDPPEVDGPEAGGPQVDGAEASSPEPDPGATVPPWPPAESAS